MWEGSGYSFRAVPAFRWNVQYMERLYINIQQCPHRHRRYVDMANRRGMTTAYNGFFMHCLNILLNILVEANTLFPIQRENHLHRIEDMPCSSSFLTIFDLDGKNWNTVPKKMAESLNVELHTHNLLIISTYITPIPRYCAASPAHKWACSVEKPRM